MTYMSQNDLTIDHYRGIPVEIFDDGENDVTFTIKIGETPKSFDTWNDVEDFIDSELGARPEPDYTDDNAEHRIGRWETI